jgi:hypothetical protein
MSCSRRHILLYPLAGLVGCAAPEDFRDGDNIRADRALVLVHPRYEWTRLSRGTIEIGLTRLEAGKSPENLILSPVPNGEISVIEVPPGFYFLRRLNAGNGYYRHTFEPKQTLFNARPGQINYPGDWHIKVVVLSSKVGGSLGRGYASAELRITTSVEENQQVAYMLRAKYPALNSALPLRLTKVIS